MHMTLKAVLGAAAVVFAANAAAQIMFYEREGFRGRTFASSKPIWNFERFGFNDRASSAIVERGRWEVCEDARFQGRCVVLRRGNYGTLADLGMTNRISSARPIARPGSAQQEVEPPPAAPVYDYRVRPSE